MLIRIEGFWLPDFTHINVRVAQPGPWWWRGRPWARLNFPVTPAPKSATEGLRWIVAQLDANLRGQTNWPPPFVDRQEAYEAAERMASSGQFS
jgi:hypothetical protein